MAIIHLVTTSLPLEGLQSFTYWLCIIPTRLEVSKGKEACTVCIIFGFLIFNRYTMLYFYQDHNTQKTSESIPAMAKVLFVVWEDCAL